MENLYSKYINNQLSNEDLEKLKSHDSAEHSPELEEALHEEWNSGKDYTGVSDEIISRIKYRVDDAIGTVRRVTIPLYYKAALWAAAVLLPLFIVSSFYLFKERTQGVSDEMVVATSVGEKATVTLPDGTHVTLNSNSRLSYIPKVYNKDERHIHFSGEAYFSVFHNQECPFVIDAQGLNVEVLGTKFNLLVRKEDKDAELYLESGRVKFTSLLRHESIILSPHQKVVMNQMTGAMSVTTETDNKSMAWRQNEMIFRNAPLESVFRSLEKSYGVHIRMDYRSGRMDAFTGTLVTNDLNSDLEVLETTNNLKITKIGNTISVRKLE